MSDITISRPEVVTGHTDVICSTSIRHILAVRKSTLLQIDTLIRQLAEISAMTESTAYGRYLLNQYPPHSGCTKEYTAANRHTYPATG